MRALPRAARTSSKSGSSGSGSGAAVLLLAGSPPAAPPSTAEAAMAAASCAASASTELGQALAQLASRSGSDPAAAARSAGPPPRLTINLQAASSQAVLGDDICRIPRR